jgi:hypothetical protein
LDRASRARRDRCYPPTGLPFSCASTDLRAPA